MKDIIKNLEFDNDIVFLGNVKNIRDVEDFIEINSDIDMPELKKAVEEFKNQESTITKEEIKEVFVMLKNRELHPRGHFDKQGRFYIEDQELIDCRTPSVKYPYSQMNAGRTSKFVKAMAEKYKVNNKAELIALFVEKK